MGEHNAIDKQNNGCPNVSSNDNKENNKKKDMIEFSKQGDKQNGIKAKNEVENKNTEVESIENLKQNIITNDKLNNNEKDVSDETNGNDSNNNSKLEQRNDQKNECKKRKENKYIKYIKEMRNVRFYGNGKPKGQDAPPHGNKHKLVNNTEEIVEEPESKLETFRIRSYWTLILVFGGLLSISLGHIYLSLLVLIAITLVYKEIIYSKSIENKDKKLPQLFFIRWYWFFLTILTFGIPWIIPKFKHQFRIYKYLLKYHPINMFILAFIGFIWFVLSLRKFSLKYQFSQIGMIFVTSLFVVAQSLMHIANIYSGLIWFFIPVSSVVINDIFAYIFGILFGRTKLIKLSPKKTVEGFVGSSIITILWGVGMSYLLQNYKFFICSQNSISFIPFYSLFKSDCHPNSIFEQKIYYLSDELTTYLPINKIYYTEMVIHGLILSFFAAFLAPFGGFFASGFKRALKIKDFGDVIPGHGGFTDRADCQVFMGMFTYIYMKTFVKAKDKHHYSYDKLIDSIHKLDQRDVMDLYNHLKNMIDSKKNKKTDKNNYQPENSITCEKIPSRDNKE
ncbi:cytidine diphosphate-diacylglycerol synthase, putative [Plasmodium vinckei vinckei]|uniref:phosphatidate cytidylyltransferase n=1 Tax=Plasmodium vinckei vinckei TaxID=54757 RepID=A0A449BUD4_PLAVN|nr:cytidine diphosphate-diacylglycerol synthase, putative [Plasmodium vinckei vinckei]KEG03226.1 phosphatidate cytidylyltransferase [Plasmodium vinckei vinckei]VEV57033.1 cytidine diphosphate-diacylglycerol synthase, putative [Plasmodium vinckei vinckei]